jgi:hypothetical protein
VISKLYQELVGAKLNKLRMEEADRVYGDDSRDAEASAMASAKAAGKGYVGDAAAAMGACSGGWAAVAAPARARVRTRVAGAHGCAALSNLSPVPALAPPLSRRLPVARHLGSVVSFLPFDRLACPAPCPRARRCRCRCCC